MTTTSLVPAVSDLDVAPVLDIVVPVYNEERDLAPNIMRLHEFARYSLPFSCRITVVDNASTDATWSVAQRLAQTLTGMRSLRLEEKGRGLALRTAWVDNDATVLAYMDVDLSTDLRAVLPLVAPLLSGHSDIAIGTRLARSARVVRGPKREVVSRSYNAILRTLFGVQFSDAQCGFKAIRRDCAQRLLPLVEDRGWFFDTELLVLAEQAGLRIHEVPVDWIDDTDSRVELIATALGDLRGVVQLSRRLASGRLPLEAVRSAFGRGALAPQSPQTLGVQLLRFAVIGVLSTAAYLFVYLATRSLIDAQPANALALLITAVGNTAANRRWTFGVRGSSRAFRHQLQGLAVFAAALAMTSVSLAILRDVAPHAGRFVEVTVLVVANLAATVLRFTVLRVWVFRARTAS